VIEKYLNPNFPNYINPRSYAPAWECRPDAPASIQTVMILRK